MTTRRIMLTGIAAILVLSGVASGLLIARWMESSPTLTPPATPAATATPTRQPLLSLRPASGAPGTLVTVIGEGWPSKGKVTLYLGDSRAVALDSQPLAEPQASAQGDFIAELTMPILEIWDRAREWVIVARAGQDTVEARFRVPEPPRTSTPTSTRLPTIMPMVARLEGLVEAVAVEARLLTLKGSDSKTYVVNLSAETLLLDIESRPITLDSVRHSDRIIAEGSFSSNGTLLARRVVISRAAAATSTATPKPTETPLPQSPTATPTPPASGWRGQYYANIALSGNPVLERLDSEINFNWGAGSPDPRISVDRFSVRWWRQMSFKADGYRFHVRADDGVRFWVDGHILLDQWNDSIATTHNVDVYLTAGTHLLQVDYYESQGDAVIAVWWETITQYPDWRGEYYNNLSLSGDPALVRNDAQLAFRWGDMSPAPGLNVDRFSVRWRRVLSLPAGRYRFVVRADDGVRVWVAGTLLINQWHDAAGTDYEVTVSLSGGNYEIVVEYYENLGSASLQFGWERLPDPAAPTPTGTSTLAVTATPSLTSSPTATPSATAMMTSTPTATRTSTPMATPSRTATPSGTATRAATSTLSITPSPTPSATRTATPRLTATATVTASATASAAPTTIYISPVDALQARYFPFTEVVGPLSKERVRQVIGAVVSYRGSDFPDAPFFYFDLRQDNGQVLPVQGGPELATMALSPAQPRPPARETVILPGKALLIDGQVSPEQQTAVALSDGTRVSVIGFWNGQALVAERVEVIGARNPVWYYRSLLRAEELRAETVPLFQNLTLYVRAKGADIAKLAPDLPAALLANYPERVFIVKGVLRVSGASWSLQNPAVYMLDRQFYRRITSSEDLRGLTAPLGGFSIGQLTPRGDEHSLGPMLAP